MAATWPLRNAVSALAAAPMAVESTPASSKTIPAPTEEKTADVVGDACRGAFDVEPVQAVGEQVVRGDRAFEQVLDPVEDRGAADAP